LVWKNKLPPYWNSTSGFNLDHLALICCYSASGWMLKDRRYRCNLMEVFTMFNGYAQIDIMVLFTLDGNYQR